MVLQVPLIHCAGSEKTTIHICYRLSVSRCRSCPSYLACGIGYYLLLPPMSGQEMMQKHRREKQRRSCHGQGWKLVIFSNLAIGSKPYPQIGTQMYACLTLACACIVQLERRADHRPPYLNNFFVDDSLATIAVDGRKASSGQTPCQGCSSRSLHPKHIPNLYSVYGWCLKERESIKDTWTLSSQCSVHSSFYREDVLITFMRVQGSAVANLLYGHHKIVHSNTHYMHKQE
jgi:hypothetical protein